MSDFKKGDRVEHVDNAPGFIMTVAADQYTSGAVLTEWPNGTRHTEQAEFLRHAELDAPIDKTESICGGNIRKEVPGPHAGVDVTSSGHPIYAAKANDVWTGPRNIIHHETRESAMAAAETADAVNHPSHYTSDPSGVECIEITRHRNFDIGSAIKYLWRAGLKEDAGLDPLDKQIEDLHKSIFYINDEIKRLKKEAS